MSAEKYPSIHACSSEMETIVYIVHFTDLCVFSDLRPLGGSMTGGNLVLIQTSVFLVRCGQVNKRMALFT